MMPRWITIARVRPEFVVIGNSGASGYTVIFRGRHYPFRPARVFRWPELLANLDQTLLEHRLRRVSLASRWPRFEGGAEHELLAEVDRA